MLPLQLTATVLSKAQVRLCVTYCHPVAQADLTGICTLLHLLFVILPLSPPRQDPAYGYNNLFY